MAYLLHIDTSGDAGCVALALDGKLLCHAENTEPRNHAASINVMIDDVLARAGIKFKDLAGVAVCAGPGSYTGLRISMATAKGLCYALDIPLLLENKLTLLAHQAYTKYQKKFAYYIPVLLAREKEYFISVFNSDFDNIFPAKHITENDMEAVFAEKNDICIISEQFNDENHQKYSKNAYVESETKIDLENWLFYTFEQYECNNTVNLSTAEPFYLKQVYTHKWLIIKHKSIVQILFTHTLTMN